MADISGVTFDGARPGDALLSFRHQTIRTVYVPRGLFSGKLSVADGVALQDRGARGYVSAMGTPAVSEAGALALDWRVVSAANPSATLGDAIALLADAASAEGARLIQTAVASSAGGVDRQAADRQAAAAGGAPQVPTVGGSVTGALGGAERAVSGVLGALGSYVIVVLLILLAALYLWTKK